MSILFIIYNFFSVLPSVRCLNIKIVLNSAVGKFDRLISEHPVHLNKEICIFYNKIKENLQS